MPKGHPGDAFFKKVTHELEHDFSVHHVTVQIELGDGETCKLTSEEVI